MRAHGIAFAPFRRLARLIPPSVSRIDGDETLSESPVAGPRVPIGQISRASSAPGPPAPEF